MTYEFDQAVLSTFALEPAALSGVVLVRHARAGHRESYDGDGRTRPLDAKGRRQAEALVGELGSSRRPRCTAHRWSAAGPRLPRWPHPWAWT